MHPTTVNHGRQNWGVLLRGLLAAHSSSEELTVPSENEELGMLSGILFLAFICVFT